MLFLVYINDLATVSDKIFSVLFADDSNLFLSGKNPNALIDTMNIEVQKVIQWLRINKLSLNLDKTHFMIFRNCRGRVLLDTELIIDGIKINMVEKTKFLGVIIDQCFNFKAHILFIKGKVARCIGVLNKCKKYFNSATLLTLYYSFLYPYLNYCNCIWGNTCKTYLLPLVKLQNMAMRIIEGAERRARNENIRNTESRRNNRNVNSSNTEDIFKKLKVLNVNKLYIYCTQLLLFKYHYNKLPVIFDSFFTRNGVVHSIETRNNALFRAHKAKKSLRLRTLRVSGVRIYNPFFQRLDLNCIDFIF